MRIGICDDDPSVVKILAASLKDLYVFDILILPFDSAFSLLTYMEDTQNERLDILFLDIRLRGQSGIRVAIEIQQKWPEVQIIFCSGYPEYVQEIFQVEPVYFLLKPFDRKSVKMAVDRAVKYMEEIDQKMITLVSQGEVRTFRVREIYYVESNKHLLNIWCGNECYETRERLNDFAKRLPDEFVRCHQSYLVNINRIRSLTSTGIKLFDGRELPVSRSRYRQTREALLRYTANSI